MANRKMKPKALNLSEHKSRLLSSRNEPGPGMAWGIALLALLTGLLLLTLLR